MERFVDRSEANVGYFIELVELGHDHFADAAGRNFAFAQTVNIGNNPGNRLIHKFCGYEALVQRAIKTGANFFDVEIYARAVAFDDLRHAHFNGFKRREAFVATQTLTATANCIAGFGDARIDHLSV